MLDAAHPAAVTDHSLPMAAGVNTMSRALDDVPYHPLMEQIVDVICAKTSNKDRAFFRTLAGFFMAKMAASMRATLVTLDRGELPVNVYAIALATSGFGKGHSVSILEKQFLKPFQDRFMSDAFPTISDQTLYGIACDRALISGKTVDDELLIAQKEFKSLGPLLFTFDSATTAAVKQIRQKLLMSGAGAINLQIDEIGSNLLNAGDAIKIFYELYDQGEVKRSLRLNTNENQRSEELEGKTPTNALLFGTPSKLFDGAAVENEFQAMLEAGYGRRCIFAWGERQDQSERSQISARERFLQKSQAQNLPTLQNLAQHFALLADPRRFKWQIEVPEYVGIELATYEEICIARATGFSSHEDVRRNEMEHRYFKALKLAGAMAFVDESSEVTMDHLYYAIKLVEDSGIAFDKMLRREKNYVRLARYIAEKGGELTHADLHEALPFYKSSPAARTEMISMAVSWGYKNHVIIRKSFKDEGIEVFTGETLQKTDLNQMGFSWSDHVAYGYRPELGPFEQLDQLLLAPDLHWCNHAFENGHRTNQNALPGFNLIVLDVDGGIPLETAHELLKEYAFITATTKRHTDQAHRYRLILPTNYVLKLDQEDYKAFMNGVFEWLPFPAPTDDSADQCGKKWLTNPGGQVHKNLEGKLFDVLPFLPRTSKNETHRKEMESLQNLDNLERWFAQRIGPGNRNVQLHNYARMLIDAGQSYAQVEESLLTFNARLQHGLSEDELRATILVTAAKKIHARP